MSMAENPRAVAGDNQAPEYARRITEQMERDYKALVDGVETLLERARQQPREIDSEPTATAMGLVVKELREADKRAEAYRIAEKEPHKAAADAVDAFFFSVREKLQRRNPRDRSQRPGAADVLQARIDDFLERKRLAVEARLRAEAIEASRLAREAQGKAAREAREAEEARLAAERARKPENKEARTEEAHKAEEAASAATLEAAIAIEQAQEARIATLAKPAELSRTRGDGVLLTETRVPFAFVVDRNLLDWVALAPYFTDAEVEKALRGWAKATNHNKQMPGAEIGHRAKGQTR
jgi:hypothetical protein